MAKKNKKSKKSSNPGKAKRAKVSAKKANSKSAVKKAGKKKKPAVTKRSREFRLSEKIELEKSPHSYSTYFHRIFSKHYRGFKKPMNVVLKAVAYFFVGAFLFLSLLFLTFGRDLPNVNDLKNMTFEETTVIYDREGNVLYSVFGEENRKYVPLSYISGDSIDATLAIEDKNFYGHPGFDLVGMVRAQLKNLEEERIAQGASTITQQLAKNVFLSSEKTYERKIKELLLAIQIEWNFSKDEILEMYLNKIAYGSNAFGIEAASQTFFGKSANELTLAESAVLAALPKAPTYYSPYGQNKKELMGYCITDDDGEEEEVPVEGEATAIEEGIVVAECSSPYEENYVWGRKDQVMKRMIEDGYIVEDEMLTAWKEAQDITFKDPVYRIEAPHFVFYIKELLEKKYGKEMVQHGGLEIITTLDPHMQSIAEEAIANQAPTNKSKYNANNAGLVSIDVKTGQVLAMVGSVNYWDSEIDGQVNTTLGLRQPGSSFKPIIYAAAIQNAGIGSGTYLSDKKTVFNGRDVPRNSDGAYKGDMIVRRALASSRNIPAIKAYYLAGEEEKILELADKIGLTSLREFKDDFNSISEERGWTFHYGWPMAIGSGEVRLIDLVGAYATFSNGGSKVDVNPFLEVRRRNGELLESFYDVSKEKEQVVDPEVAYILNNILSDSYARPGGYWRNLLTVPGHTVAAKTGTSNKKIGKVDYPNNTLTIGYSPSIATGVWVGNTDGTRLRGNSWGLTAAGPIWRYFMENVLADKPAEEFEVPELIVWKGKEVFPSFAENKYFDSRFKEAEGDDDDEIPEPDWLVIKPEVEPESSTEVVVEPEPVVKVVEVPPPSF